MAVDNDLKQMMRELGQALVHAIAASPKVADAARKIRHQGYSLYLALDRSESGTQIELTTGEPGSNKPAFLLNKGDVSFLASVGIDATRSGKRRRSHS